MGLIDEKNEQSKNKESFSYNMLGNLKYTD